MRVSTRRFQPPGHNRRSPLGDASRVLFPQSTFFWRSDMNAASARAALSGVDRDLQVQMPIGTELTLGPMTVDLPSLRFLGVHDRELLDCLRRHRLRMSDDLSSREDRLIAVNGRAISMFELPGRKVPYPASPSSRGFRLWMVTDRGGTKVYAPFVPFEMGRVAFSDRANRAISHGKLIVSAYLTLHQRGELHALSRAEDYVANELSAATGGGRIESHWDVEIEGKTHVLSIRTELDHGHTAVRLDPMR